VLVAWWWRREDVEGAVRQRGRKVEERREQ
jgi:hypothetical protein